MVADKAVSGSCTTNPFKFQNFGINYHVLHVNSELVPRIALEPNFTTGEYMRENITVLEALGFDIGPNTWSIRPSEWANGYNIYAFKITPGSIGSVRLNQLTGDVGLEAKFSDPTCANITLIVLSEEPATLEIDSFGHLFI